MKNKSFRQTDSDYDDALADAHLHTADNRKEVESSRFCYCICCQTFFKPTEIENYTDGGATVVCPYCDCDAVIGEGCGIRLTDELLDSLHQRYFNYDDIEDRGMEIYIATDLLFVDGAYRFNAVYAFKSKRSVKSYEKYLKTTCENHKLAVTPATVSDSEQSIQVITEFSVTGDFPEYKSTTVFDDYDAARDYVEDIKATQTSITVEHDMVKIQSRFSPAILNSGWA